LDKGSWEPEIWLPYSKGNQHVVGFLYCGFTILINSQGFGGGLWKILCTMLARNINFVARSLISI